MPELLYLQLAARLRREIETGQRSAGDKLPSIRQLCRQTQLSKSTVLAAYERLEADGLIRAQSRSGYYVAARQQALELPATSSPVTRPASIDSEQLLLDIMAQGAAFDLLGDKQARASEPEPNNEPLRRCLSRAQRRQTSQEYLYYDEPMGLASLRQQIVPLMQHGGAQVDAQQLLISNGCQHSLMMALMATTQAGDTVALESPGFYGSIQLLEALGLKAIELPCSAATGLSPDALALALEHWPIKALIVSPCYATPTGACMPEENKQALVALCQQHDVAIIEDDIYGELYFGLQRPRSLYSYASDGRVLLCSSFAKNLSRDLRIGWIAPGRYLDKVKRLKLASQLASSQALQQGLSYYLAEASFERHLRRKRQQYQQRCQQLLGLIQTHLPMAKSCSQPQGGLALWLELPEHINSVELYNQARSEGIVLSPGPMFTAQNRYRNFLRLSFAHPWNSARQQAIMRLGELVEADGLLANRQNCANVRG
ncbi:MAG: PLP-dependent aminotransferase family protein [Cellvibrionaceae bacterium]|nr:PLP-dependent aminotransferase family protein [Cellvibrionaceae bacterium]